MKYLFDIKLTEQFVCHTSPSVNLVFDLQSVSSFGSKIKIFDHGKPCFRTLGDGDILYVPMDFLKRKPHTILHVEIEGEYSEKAKSYLLERFNLKDEIRLIKYAL
jgi:hypothetical protein